MKNALVLIKPLPHYRKGSFEDGLRRLGYTITNGNHRPERGDVLVTWNLTGGLEQMAARYTQAGATVLVAENAYLTPPGRTQMYALAVGGHNGAGRFPATQDATRWKALGVDLKPWRNDGRHVLVLGQRGIGSKAMASPHGWHQRIAEKLARVTKRPIRVRAHPGESRSGAPLAADLKDAWAVVLWSSAAGVQALVAGVPVFYAAPQWIASRAALPIAEFSARVESPLCSYLEREAAMIRLSHGQWTHEEIASGEALHGVLKC